MKVILLTCLASWALVSGTTAAEDSASEPAAAITIRADWFDRANIRVSTTGQAYADKYACIWNAGAVPNQSEYDLEIPMAAEYRFVGLYTAAASRPVEIHVDGKCVHTGFSSVTGSWQTSRAQWENQCKPAARGRDAYDQAALPRLLHAPYLCIPPGIPRCVARWLETDPSRTKASSIRVPLDGERPSHSRDTPAGIARGKAERRSHAGGAIRFPW